MQGTTLNNQYEIDFILFLKDSKTPQKINNILKLVWGYSADLETHTIETHVHRLQKKFLLSRLAAR